MHASIVFLTWPSAADAKQYFGALTWTEVKHLYNVGERLFTTFAYFLGAIAALGVLWRLPKIVEVVREFQKNSGPIWDLRNTVNELKVLVPDFTHKVQTLQTQIKEQIEGKLLELQDQVSAGQRYAADNLLQPQFDSPDATPDDDWKTIKKTWTDARDQLESIIEEADGRRTRKYAKLPRYDYSDVIETLLEDGLIDKSIAEDAQYMNREFRSLRNRKRQVLFRLALGVEHEHVPSAARARLATFRRFMFGRKQIALTGNRFVALPPALLGFEDKRISAIEVNPADRIAVVAMARHDSFEHVVVAFTVSASGVGMWQPQCVAQFSEEQRVVRALLPTLLALPLRYEGLCFLRRIRASQADRSHSTPSGTLSAAFGNARVEIRKHEATWRKSLLSHFP